jgi:glycosyltransferase involved in cell wall biosynthesis
MTANLLFGSWYVGMGGGETDLVALAEHLPADRYSPHLLVPFTGQLTEIWQEHGWPVHVLPFRGATRYFIPGVWARFPVVRQMEALLREHAIMAVHSDYHSLPLLQPAAHRAGIPLVWTCWGWWFRPLPWQRGFFRQTDRIFTRSAAIRDGFAGDPPFMPPADLPLVYSGVDVARFHPGIDGQAVRHELGIADDVPLAAMIARFQDVKGHHTFQAMVRLVAQTRPDVRFVVAGEDVHGVSADAAYKARIVAAHTGDPDLHTRVTYLGFRPDAERIIAAADVVVVPSRFESYGRVGVEAMACGRPVVSTSAGGPSETIIDGETGLLVPPEDPSALASALLRLLADPDERARMGQAGRARALAHFSAEAMARPYIAAFDAWAGRAP